MLTNGLENRDQLPMKWVIVPFDGGDGRLMDLDLPVNLRVGTVSSTLYPAILASARVHSPLYPFRLGDSLLLRIRIHLTQRRFRPFTSMSLTASQARPEVPRLGIAEN